VVLREEQDGPPGSPGLHELAEEEFAVMEDAFGHSGRSRGEDDETWSTALPEGGDKVVLGGSLIGLDRPFAVRTERDGPISRVSVTDNGCGFDPSAVPAQRYGLRGMRERAELIGASLDIRSRHQDGTRITVEVTTEEAPRA